MTPFASTKTFSHKRIGASAAVVAYKFQWSKLRQRPDRGNLVTCEHCGHRTKITTIVTGEWGDLKGLRAATLEISEISTHFRIEHSLQYVQCSPGGTMKRTITLSPVPEGKITGGFIEVGKPNDDGSEYEFEDNVDFFLGSDGKVYAEVCALAQLPDAE